MIKKLLFLAGIAFSVAQVACQPLSQKKQFTHQDTLRGSNGKYRAWWDVQKYSIHVTPDIEKESIAGVVLLQCKVTSPGSRLQIDLQQPMHIDRISLGGQTLKMQRDGNVYFVDLPTSYSSGMFQLEIQYSGTPRKAIRPPWDGGWIWKKDEKGRPWVSVACQGLGASVWYPCKDYQGDEPDHGAALAITIPDTLVAVGNGQLEAKTDTSNHLVTYRWEVKDPINNYNIIPYIGKYVHWGETYNGEKGPLSCDYWVLDYNLAKAKEQFKQVPLMLKCFEYWFGPYPFYEDGYKLVESPHLGMEHQSAVAYGNHFQNGYLGRDLSASGQGLKWDFIIVHESGHEWFGNNITSKDIADMWVHEGFTAYSETLFTTCQYGTEAGNDYVIGTRRNMQNDMPVIGHYGVNQEGSGDMYYKGANMLHTIRQVINNDTLFRNILRGLNRDFYHQTVTSAQVEKYISDKAGIDFSKVFNQYLRTAQVPVLEYAINGKKLRYRWTNCVDGFDLPIKLKDSDTWLRPTKEWQTMDLPAQGTDSIAVDRNFYVETQRAKS